MEGVRQNTDRFRALVEAGVSISSELSLEALLQTLVEKAAELTGARYAALGVIDRAGTELERFVTTGIDPGGHAAIGDLPRGRGILGTLIRDAKTLRLHDLTEDPRSAGIPPNHPPMHSFLGVPIVLRGVPYGNFYLTEKKGGEDFDDEDEEVVAHLASQAAVAIENARLYEAATGWSKQLESLNEVGNALATETDLDRLLDLIARRLRELLDARVVIVALPTGGDELGLAAVAGENADRLVDQTMTRSGSKSGRVLERAQSERTDSVLDDPDVDPEITRLLRARTGLSVPLVPLRGAPGPLGAARPPPWGERRDRRARQARSGRPLLGQRPAPGGDVRDARGGCGRPFRAIRARRLPARDRRARARAQAALSRAPRRDGASAHVHPPRPAGARGHARDRGVAPGHRPPAGARRRDAAGRPPPRARAAAERARRLRPCGGRRAPDDDLGREERDEGRLRRRPRRRAPADRGRDGALPDRAGVAHEHRQACPGATRQHCAHEDGGLGQGGGGGRRAGIRPRGHGGRLRAGGDG